MKKVLTKMMSLNIKIIINKVHIAFTILLLLPLSAYSQVEWFPIGAEWHYESGSFPINPVRNHHFVVEKDTIVEGKACKLISGNYRHYIVYEENGCVYYYFNNKFRKIYDFSVNVGDVVDLEFKSVQFHGESTIILPCHVDKVTYKLVNGLELKEVHTTYSIDPSYITDPTDVWFEQLMGTFVYLEKIGCERPGLGGGEFIPHVGSLVQTPAYYYMLKSYYDSDIGYTSNLPLYNSKDEIATHPNPVKDRLFITNKSEYELRDVSMFIYDLAGRVVLAKEVTIPCELSVEHLTSGIYFIRITNGTKCLMFNKLIIK